jgi:hypothetical protein
MVQPVQSARFGVFKNVSEQEQLVGFLPSKKAKTFDKAALGMRPFSMVSQALSYSLLPPPPFSPQLHFELNKLPNQQSVLVSRQPKKQKQAGQSQADAPWMPASQTSVWQVPLPGWLGQWILMLLLLATLFFAALFWQDGLPSQQAGPENGAMPTYATSGGPVEGALLLESPETDVAPPAMSVAPKPRQRKRHQ